MLTTSAKGRAFDYNRVVGGRPFRGIIYVTQGTNDDLYVVLRDTYGSDILKLTVGPSIDDEEISLSFREVHEQNFDGDHLNSDLPQEDHLELVCQFHQDV